MAHNKLIIPNAAFSIFSKWYPLGAASEIRLITGLDSCNGTIFDESKLNIIGFYDEQPTGK